MVDIAEGSPRRLSIWERFPELNKIPKERFPNHVFFIPDGNRRFARGLSQEAIVGHQKGLEVAFEILRNMRELPTRFVSLWAFSSDNWKRPEFEIAGLMALLDVGIRKNLAELMERNIRFVHLGRKDRIPQSFKETIESTEQLTRENTGQIVSVAIDFGGMDQQIRMTEKARNIPKEIPITPELLTSLRDGGGLIPPADLLIRTSEQRTSDPGWLVGAQTELYFIPDKFFPEINTAHVVAGIIKFAETDRRLGR